MASKQYGRYVLEERIAMGGMAEIFRARTANQGFEKRVCIKRILPHFLEQDREDSDGGGEFVTMFRDEARTAAKLQHANCVQVFDFGEEDGTLFLAMELVDGCDLRRLVEASKKKKIPIEVGEVLQVGIEVCRGLHHAHTLVENGRPLGIVHRDISPHNILISRAGEVKVTDFGIARAAERATHTSTGIVKGKVAYMSPEQAQGLEFDHRLDQFALGVVLWEMLCGIRLFTGENDAQILKKVLTCDVAAPSTIRRGVPAALDDVILRMMQVRPADRFGDMRVLELALQRVLFSGAIDPQTADVRMLFERVMGEPKVAEVLRKTQVADAGDFAPGASQLVPSTQEQPDLTSGSSTESGPSLDSKPPSSGSDGVSMVFSTSEKNPPAPGPRVSPYPSPYPSNPGVSVPMTASRGAVELPPSSRDNAPVIDAVEDPPASPVDLPREFSSRSEPSMDPLLAPTPIIPGINVSDVRGRLGGAGPDPNARTVLSAEKLSSAPNVLTDVAAPPSDPTAQGPSDAPTKVPSGPSSRAPSGPSLAAPTSKPSLAAPSGPSLAAPTSKPSLAAPSGPSLAAPTSKPSLAAPSGASLKAPSGPALKAPSGPAERAPSGKSAPAPSASPPPAVTSTKVPTVDDLVPTHVEAAAAPDSTPATRTNVKGKAPSGPSRAAPPSPAPMTAEGSQLSQEPATDAPDSPLESPLASVSMLATTTDTGPATPLDRTPLVLDDDAPKSRRGPLIAAGSAGAVVVAVLVAFVVHSLPPAASTPVTPVTPPPTVPPTPTTTSPAPTPPTTATTTPTTTAPTPTTPVAVVPTPTPPTTVPTTTTVPVVAVPTPTHVVEKPIVAPVKAAVHRAIVFIKPSGKKAGTVIIGGVRTEVVKPGVLSSQPLPLGTQTAKIESFSGKVYTLSVDVREKQVLEIDFDR